MSGPDAPFSWLDDEGPSAADLAMVRRAVREGWPMTSDTRRRLIDALRVPRFLRARVTPRPDRPALRVIRCDEGE